LTRARSLVAVAVAGTWAALGCTLTRPLDDYAGAPRDASASDVTSDAASDASEPGEGSLADARLDSLGPMTTLAKDQNEIRGLGVDDQYVYFTDTAPVTSGVFRVLKGGPARSADASAPLVASPPGTWQIAVDQLLYWTVDDASGSVMKAKKDGVGAAAAIASRAKPRAIVTDAANVYFAEVGTASVQRLPKTGGAPVALFGGDSALAALALDDANLYAAGARGVTRVPKAGGAACTIGDGAAATAIVVSSAPDAPSVYWATADGSIFRASADCGATGSRLATAQGAVAAMAMDASAVYWVTTVTGGANAVRIPRTSSASSADLDVFGTSLKGARAEAVAVDDTGVYWATACCVWRHAKL
jgi:hypothetical protein